MNTIQELIKNQENIRLISVIAHVDHGKTTLTDSLLAKSGLIDEDQAGSKRGTDTMDEEKERGITIRSTGVTMSFHNVTKKDDDYVVHLVDSPGHVDFSSEVTAALRVSDGAVVVVDCVEGVCVQTETVLRQALAERVKPILVLNKIDRAILELKYTPEDAYKSFVKTIDSVNQVLGSFDDPALGDITFAPEKGNVVFASGLFGWGFTLPQFARKIASKTGAKEEKILKYLWGDNFFDPKTKKVVASPVSSDGRPLERYVCQVILNSVFNLITSIMSGDVNQVEKMLKAVNVAMPSKEWEKIGKELMRSVMRRFLPLADALLETVISHLPSPKQAQKYRVDSLYDGDKDDRFAKAIRECDPNGPLVAFISKLFPVPNTKTFFAFGRVFSGTARPGQRVFVIDDKNKLKKKELPQKNLQGVLCNSIRSTSDRLEECPCGNLVVLAGIDSLLVKSGTVTDAPDAGSIRGMTFSVSPVVRVAVACKYPADLRKLVDGLRALSKVDSVVQCTIDEASGEHIIGAAGDLHLQVCLSILQNSYCKGIEIEVSEPMVPFRETVIGVSQALLTKSPNKHNRLYASAEPLSKELCDAIDNNEVNVTDDSSQRANALIDKFLWDPIEAKKKIWAFGPETEPTNSLVDQTHGLQNLGEIKESFVASFHWASLEGPLCGEPLRGVKINIADANLHADAIHRGGGQIIPTAKRLVHACVLAAQPRLMEPVFLVEIQTTQDVSSNIYGVMSKRRGHVFSEEIREGTPIVVVKAHLPVHESFGLTADLREACHGQAFPQCSMSHWQVVEGDPYTPGSLSNSIVKKVRDRKRMPLTLPQLESLVDKL